MQRRKKHQLISTMAPFLALLLLLSTTFAAAAPSCNPDDKNALLAIKASFQNPDILANWAGATDCCAWNGVECDSDSSRVVNVFISGSVVMSGSLPEAISGLSFLRILYMADLPLLTGTIPRSITRLPNLVSLTIFNTSLSGPIPRFISQIASLKDLNLGSNNFVGVIPEDLPLLRSLLSLRLSGNRLTGGIPASFRSFNMSSPPQLYLSDNLLSGEIPRELGRLDWVGFDVSNNQLEGDASMLFGAGKGTLWMNLSGNKFQFELSRVSFPRRLRALILNRNRISGSIPAEINQLDGLSALNLSDNDLSGEIPVGVVTRKFGKESYEGNKGLCGPPLGPCPSQ